MLALRVSLIQGNLKCCKPYLKQDRYKVVTCVLRTRLDSWSLEGLRDKTPRGMIAIIQNPAYCFSSFFHHGGTVSISHLVQILTAKLKISTVPWEIEVSSIMLLDEPYHKLHV